MTRGWLLPSGRTLYGETVPSHPVTGETAPEGFVLVREDGDDSGTVWELPEAAS